MPLSTSGEQSQRDRRRNQRTIRVREVDNGYLVTDGNGSERIYQSLMITLPNDELSGDGPADSVIGHIFEFFQQGSK